MTATTPGRTDSLVDVVGLSVGHHHELDADATLGSGAATGCTVVLAPHGATGAVDVRGGGPGTRETDLLDPSHSVRKVHAIVLTGGSAYGLAAADGVMRWLEEHGHGIAMGEPDQVVPIVPAAVIFDLPVGDWRTRPTAEFGTGQQSPRRTPCSPVRWAPESGRGRARSKGGSERRASSSRTVPRRASRCPR